MTTLLNLFYQLPLEFIAQCFLLASLAYLCVFQHFGHCRWFRRGVEVTLIIGIVAMLWITMLGRAPDTAHPPKLIPFHSYRMLLETGNKEILRTNFMNVALFYPAGLLAASLLPKKWSRGQKLLSVVIVFALFSFMIEYTQFRFFLGEPEIDDLIHNTLGVALGTFPIIFQNILYNPSP